MCCMEKCCCKQCRCSEVTCCCEKKASMCGCASAGCGCVSECECAASRSLAQCQPIILQCCPPELTAQTTPTTTQTAQTVQECMSCCYCCDGTTGSSGSAGVLSGNAFGSMLFTAGTGKDVHVFNALSVNVPFGAQLYESGGAISHSANAAEFVVLKSGTYLVTYQMSAYNPAVSDSQPIAHVLELYSTMNGGAVDTVNFTEQKQLVKRSVTLSLTAGDILYFKLSHGDAQTEMSANSQAVSFLKL